MIYTKETPFGFKKLPNNKAAATHVSMEIEEYEGILKREVFLENNLKHLKNKAAGLCEAHKKDQEQLRQTAIKQLAKYKSDAERQIRKAQNDAVLFSRDLSEKCNQLDSATKRIRELEKNNAALQRIARERANAERNITPKKSHDGYLIIGSRQWTETITAELPEPGYEAFSREWLIQNNRIVTERRSLKVWKTTLQSPYDVCIPAGQVIQMIDADLNQHILDNMGYHGINKASVNETASKNDDSYGHVYKCEYSANCRNGFWEVEIYSEQPALLCPERVLTTSKAIKR